MLHLTENSSARGGLILHPRTVALLNAHFADQPADARLDYALSGALGKIALVSSFGAEAAVLLHLAARINPATPVLFLDTALLFPETLAYQRDLAAHLGLTDVRVLHAETATTDPDNTLHQRDPDACCALRKTAPLTTALQGFDGWITGRKRFQSGARRQLDIFETDAQTARLKLNPLADWSPAQIAGYFEDHTLPRHPLITRGYGSLGCAPCTTPIASGEDPRAGRWRGSDKQECGIHVVNGRIERIAS
jgi:phosphoadenosine phosphosulfate reductase